MQETLPAKGGIFSILSENQTLSTVPESAERYYKFRRNNRIELGMEDFAILQNNVYFFIRCVFTTFRCDKISGHLRCLFPKRLFQP